MPPRIPDDVVKDRFARGLSDAEIAEGYPGTDSDYAFRRRMRLRLLRAPGRKVGEAAGAPKPSRHAAHSVKGRPFTMPAVDNAAFSEARTIFPTTVVDVAGLNNVLVSGVNSKKIGGMITKGPAKGFPIYTLTLEERATCPTSCRHWRSCVVPGTRVLTADLDWVPIETLSVGQKIVGFDEYHEANGRRKSRASTVEAIGRAQRPCFEVVTDSGTVIASDDHLWVAKQDRSGYDWFRTDALRPGDQIQFLSKPWERATSYDAGRLRGFVEGEGYVSTWSNNGFTKTRLGWSQLPGRLLDEINAIARDLGFSVSERRVTSGINSSDVALVELDGGWRETLRFLGMIRPSRLFDRIPEVIDGRVLDGRGSTAARVLSVRPVGLREVVTIATSTKTLFTEGFASHNCYGNNMHLAKRIQHGPAFEARLEAELAILQSRHPGGFAVRLHVLGDFYSVEYVELWRTFLLRYRSLFVFGFTARWERSDPIAVALLLLVTTQRERFAIRFSNAPVDEDATVSIEHPIQKPADAIICPAQTGKTESCGTCGLCWHSRRRIAFLQH